MNVTDLQIARQYLPLRTPFKTALRTVETAESIIVRLTTDTGHIGWGEAPSTVAITGDSLESIEACLLSTLRPCVIGAELASLAQAVHLVRMATPKDFNARAALDTALWDLAAQRAGMPLYELLGGWRDSLETDFTISVAAPEVMAEAAERAQQGGFRSLKIKLGGTHPSASLHGERVGNAQADCERFKRIRQRVGAELELRIDANQAWNEEEANHAAPILADLGAAFLEQPLDKAALPAMARLRRQGHLPIVADESVFGAQDAVEVVRCGAADALNIKLTKAGGITEALDIAAVARAAGLPYMVGTMIESRLGITAAAHFALGQRGAKWIDMDGPLMLSEDPIAGGVVYEGARLRPSQAPGLGIQGVRLGEGVTWRHSHP